MHGRPAISGLETVGNKTESFIWMLASSLVLSIFIGGIQSSVSTTF